MTELEQVLDTGIRDWIRQTCAVTSKVMIFGIGDQKPESSHDQKQEHNPLLLRLAILKEFYFDMLGVGDTFEDEVDAIVEHLNELRSYPKIPITDILMRNGAHLAFSSLAIVAFKKTLCVVLKDIEFFKSLEVAQ